MSVLHNTKLWLIIIAIGHIGLGAGGSYATYGNDELAIIGFFTVVGVYLLYAAFMLEGQAQARLAAVFAGPIVVWFLVCAAMGLEPTYATENVEWKLSPELIPPLFFWGMTALTGLLGWNMEESAPDTDMNIINLL